MAARAGIDLAEGRRSLDHHRPVPGRHDAAQGRADAGADDGLIETTFSKLTGDELPSAPGEQFQIIAAVYSNTNWMAGQWISGWIEAVPTDGDSRSRAVGDRAALGVESPSVALLDPAAMPAISVLFRGDDLELFAAPKAPISAEGVTDQPIVGAEVHGVDHAGLDIDDPGDRRAGSVLAEHSCRWSGLAVTCGAIGLTCSRVQQVAGDVGGGAPRPGEQVCSATAPAPPAAAWWSGRARRELFQHAGGFALPEVMVFMPMAVATNPSQLLMFSRSRTPPSRRRPGEQACCSSGLVMAGRASRPGDAVESWPGPNMCRRARRPVVARASSRTTSARRAGVELVVDAEASGTVEREARPAGRPSPGRW